MAPSDDCLDLIKTFEGVRLKTYRCSAGVPTIGYGATGPDIRMGMTWTMVQAETRLKADVTRFAIGVTALIGKSKTSQANFDALVSLAFNIGLAAFKTSSVLKNHLAGRNQAASAAFGLWVKARVNGKLTVLPGLVRRRAAEAKLYSGA